MTRRRGFTLLEVLLATLLLTLLVGGLYVFHLDLLRTRRQNRRQAAAEAALGRVMGLMAREIGAMSISPLREQSLEGNAEEVTFSRTTVPGPVVYQEGASEGPGAVASEGRALPHHDILRVSYALRRQADEEGLEHVTGLERLCIRRPPAGLTEAPADPGAALVSRHVRFVHLRYWDGQAWIAGWGGGDVPRAVWIRLGLEELPENTPPEDYPYPVLERIVAVSVAQSTQSRLNRSSDAPPEGPP